MACPISCNITLSEVTPIVPAGSTQPICPPTADTAAKSKEAMPEDTGYPSTTSPNPPNSSCSSSVAKAVNTVSVAGPSCPSSVPDFDGGTAVSLPVTNVASQSCPTGVASKSCPTEVDKETYDGSHIDDPDIPVINFSPTIPTLDDVTTEIVDGTGVFDSYMRAGMNQLNTQYEQGRIKGADYAQVYISQMQLMMTEANKFVLGVAQTQIAVMQAQIAAEMFNQQYLSIAYDAMVKKASIGKMEAEAALTAQKIEETRVNTYKIKAESSVACQQEAQLKESTIKTKAETSMVCQQEAEAKERTFKTRVDRDMVSQQLAELKINGRSDRALTKHKIESTKEETFKIKAESSLVCQQTAEKKENTAKIKSDRDMNTQQIAELRVNGVVDRDLKCQQIESAREAITKIRAEGTLLMQQTAEKKESALKIILDGKMTAQQIAELKLNGVIEREVNIQKIEVAREGINKSRAENLLICQQTAEKAESTDKVKAEAALLHQQNAELKANGKTERELKGAQKQTQISQAELYQRQVKGYSEKNKNENAKMLLDAWAVQAVEEPDPTQYKIASIADNKLETFADEVKSAGGFTR